MKKIFTLFLSLSFCLSLSAQLADGSMVPANLEFTDINGNLHNIQNYLDSGKVVLIDVYATWCGPCWFLHENSALKNLHNAYGPDGTDEMVILSIEGDDETSNADLNGTGSNTLGDWVTGTPYPVIEDNSAPGTFNLTFWPTIFIIRPTGEMILANDYVFENIFDPSSDHVYDLAMRGNNDGKLTTSAGSQNICEPTNVSGGTIILQNLGSNDLTAATIDIMQDGAMIDQLSWEGNVTPFSTAFISAPTFENVAMSTEFQYAISTINEVDDSFASDNTAGFEVTRPLAEQTIELTITTDKWPEEISWNFKDENGDIIASNNDLGTLDCETTYTQTVDVTGTGCYSFNISDAFGDGILNGGVNPASHGCTNGDSGIAIGEISLKGDGVEYFSTIAYGAGTSIDIAALGSTSVKPISSLNDAKVFPNPANDRVQLNFALLESANIGIQVTNILGQTMANLGTQNFVDGENKIEVETNDFANGIYFLTLSKGKEISTFRFSVAH